MYATISARMVFLPVLLRYARLSATVDGVCLVPALCRVFHARQHLHRSGHWRLYLVKGAPEAELSKYVENATDFRASANSTVLLFSDEIPVWIKIGRGKQIYCRGELQKRRRGHGALEEDCIRGAWWNEMIFVKCGML